VTAPVHLGLYVLGVSLLIALGFVIFGALRVTRHGQALKLRLDAYAELPLREDVERTELRVTAVQRSAAGLPRLRARATAAVAAIEQARLRILGVVGLVRFALKKYVRGSA
jgi:hypothetical protein